jgi:hypothetical protein
VLDTGASRRRPDESREPSQRLGPGFHREPWIPAGVYPDENRGRNDKKDNYGIYGQTLIITAYQPDPDRWIDFGKKKI